MQKNLLIILLASCSWLMTGCISIPYEQLSADIEVQELSSHVHFLAQPALKGRKPKTRQSKIARQYLTSRFEKYGLVPWPRTNGYEQPFALGTNVIGILPGSDPNLADQIVIVAAHYDHLGKTKNGVCLGACDNASGVAVMLELAEQLSLRQKRPRRTVCFASFDCEEQFTLGSLVFTCNRHFDSSKIAAVVNIDLLGRDFLEVARESLFVVGTELYPSLRENILQDAEQAGLRILPIGTDVVGPTGDHVVFETIPIPVLFFTCGVYKDYHKPTDTARGLNYSKMKKSARVIANTLYTLANADQIPKPVTQKSGDRQELRTLNYIFQRINREHKKLKLSDEQLEEFRLLAGRTHQLMSMNQYTVKQRRQLLRKTITALLPMMVPTDGAGKDSNSIFLCLSELYATHRTVAIDAARKLVKHMLENKPGLFGRTRFKHRAYDLCDDEIHLAETPDGEYELHVLLPRLDIDYRLAGPLFKSGEAAFSFSLKSLTAKGSKEQITDCCLLMWTENLEDESFAKAWQKVLAKVTNIQRDWSYHQWLKWRLKQTPYHYEKQWLLALIESDNPYFASLARTRKDVIALENGHYELLLPLVDALDDHTPCIVERHFVTPPNKTGPFADHPCLRQVPEKAEKITKNPKPLTTSDLALIELKSLTKKNFGKNKRAWRKWIETRMKQA